METTLLSTLISRMQRWTTITRNTEEQYLVYDLDEALRSLKRTVKTPWSLKKSTLRVFSDVLEYPKASDHNGIAIIEGQENSYGEKPKPYYTSIQEFYEDPNNQSQIAEIWDNGVNYLGVRNKNLDNTNQVLDTCELDDGYTISGDITAKAIDNVIYKTGNGSLRLTVVNSSGTATLEKTFTAFTSSLYQRKYVFFKVFLSSVPTSINLRVGADSSNYLLKNVTTQFSGQAFKANDFNIIAIDLNSPDSTVGTISTSTSFDYYMFQMVGASSGLYYLDEVALKEWKLMDYWYYSNYAVATVGQTVPNQSYFRNDSEIYSADSLLVGPTEFADVIVYEALLSSIADAENSKLYPVIKSKRDDAWETLLDSFPDMEPLMITHTWRFASQMGNLPSLNGDPSF